MASFTLVNGKLVGDSEASSRTPVSGYRTRQKYQDVLDSQAYQTYAEQQTQKFKERQQKEKALKEAELQSRISEQEQKYSVRERIKRQIESGTTTPELIQRIQKKREEIYTKEAEATSRAYEEAYAKSFEADKQKTTQEIESARGRFVKRVPVGVEYFKDEQGQQAVQDYIGGLTAGGLSPTQAVEEYKLSLARQTSTLKVTRDDTPFEGPVVYGNRDSFFTAEGNLKTKADYDKETATMNKLSVATRIVEDSFKPTIDFGKAEKDVRFSDEPEREKIIPFDSAYKTEFVSGPPSDIGDKEYNLRIAEIERKLNPAYTFTDVLIPSVQDKLYNLGKEMSDFNKRWEFGVEPINAGVRINLKGEGFYNPVTEDTIVSQQGSKREVIYKPKRELGFGELYNLPIKNPLTKTIGADYDIATDVFGTGLSYLSFDRANRNLSLNQLDKNIADLGKGVGGIKYVNPKDVATAKLDKELEKNIQEEFNTSKLVVESAGYVVGGPIATASILGQASRAKDVNEAIPPLLLGASIRVLSPKVMQSLSGVIGKINLRFEGTLDKYFGSKLPVPSNLFATRKFGDLLPEDKIAKGLLIGGASVEVAGLQVTPTDLQQEYIRKVGIFNAFTPIGYRATDFGIALGKSIAIKTLAPLKGFKTYEIEELMKPETFEKFSKTGGGTPIEIGDESVMIKRFQGIEPQVVAKDFDIDLEKSGQGLGFRSKGGKLYDIELPSMSYYEAGYDSFYAPEVHPIALSGVGLKQKLFKPIGGAYDRVRLFIDSPSIEATFVETGTAIKVGDITLDSYKGVKDIYGFNIVDKGLDVGKSLSSSFDIEPNVPLYKAEFEKIMLGGRPFKTREPLSWLGQGALDEFYFSAKGSYSAQTGNLISSQSRALGITTEAEALLGVPRIRLDLPQTNLASFNIFGKNISIPAPTKLFRKLGFASAYVNVKGEMIPMNIERVMTPTSTSVVLSGTQRKMLTSGNAFLTGSGGNEVALLTPAVRKVSASGTGGMSDELRRVFGGYKLEESYPYGSLVSLSGNRIPSVVVRDVPRVPSVRFPTRTSDRRIIARPDVLRVTDRVVDRVPDRTPVLRVPVRVPDVRIPDRPTPIRVPIRVPDIRVPPRTPDRTIIRRPDIERPPPTQIQYSSFALYPVPIIKPKGLLSKAYSVTTRVGGKEKLLAIGLPKGRALSLGSAYAREQTARSFKIKEVGLTRRKDVPLPRLTQFRKPKRGGKVSMEGFTYVEKSKYAIDSPTELKEITYKGLLSKKTKPKRGIVFGKLPKISVKAKPYRGVRV